MISTGHPEALEQKTGQNTASSEAAEIIGQCHRADYDGRQVEGGALEEIGQCADGHLRTLCGFCRFHFISSDRHSMVDRANTVD